MMPIRQDWLLTEKFRGLNKDCSIGRHSESPVPESIRIKPDAILFDFNIPGNSVLPYDPTDAILKL
jgi:hypothetical protein